MTIATKSRTEPTIVYRIQIGRPAPAGMGGERNGVDGSGSGGLTDAEWVGSGGSWVTSVEEYNEASQAIASTATTPTTGSQRFIAPRCSNSDWRAPWPARAPHPASPASAAR